MKNKPLTEGEIAYRKRIVVDPCPWHPDTLPGWSVGLEGCRDEPSVYIQAQCPKCRVSRAYGPTEREVQDHYSSRYSLNNEMIAALWPKLVKMWNWKTPVPNMNRKEKAMK